MALTFNKQSSAAWWTLTENGQVLRASKENTKALLISDVESQPSHFGMVPSRFNLFSNFLSGFPSLVGKIRLWGFGPDCRVLYSLSAATRASGIGISRSSLSFGLNPRCFFAVTRTRLRLKSISDQVEYLTSLSRSPVKRSRISRCRSPSLS